MLEKIMFEIKSYVPYAKIAITHGRMKGPRDREDHGRLYQ
jgi:transcription-repair coupling factor (superfamily II helicase)